MLAHSLDDYAILAISIVALLVIGAMWKKQSLAGLRKQHNVLPALLIVALIFQIYAFIAESNDPTDLGNDYPSLTILVLMLINKSI
jgi:hypothetical protein